MVTSVKIQLYGNELVIDHGLRAGGGTGSFFPYGGTSTKAPTHKNIVRAPF